MSSTMLSSKRSCWMPRPSTRARSMRTPAKRQGMQSLEFTRMTNRPQGQPPRSAGIVRQRAKAIQDTTRGRVSLELALLMLTEQPSLMSEAPARLARRILDMSTALNIKQADAAQLLASNPLLLQALPYEMNARVQALASVMQRGTLETMHAVARDITLLDHAPLQLQHDISNLAVSLKLSYAAASAMVQLQPLVIRVEPEAVASRASTLAQLLQLQPLTTQLLQLLQQHPELLLPPSSLTVANHQNLLLLESVTPSILSSWLHQAPLLVITPADVVAHRLAEVRQLLGDSTDQLQVISYIALDARVLLCSKAVLQERLRVLPQLMGVARDQADKMAKQHPVYLAMDPGAVDLWLRDIQQLTLADEQQARGLAQEPAVLRSGPEQVLQALERVAAAQGCSVVQALDHCAQQHALLTGALSC